MYSNYDFSFENDHWFMTTMVVLLKDIKISLGYWMASKTYKLTTEKKYIFLVEVTFLSIIS